MKILEWWSLGRWVKKLRNQPNKGEKEEVLFSAQTAYIPNSSDYLQTLYILCGLIWKKMT